MVLGQPGSRKRPTNRPHPPRCCQGRTCTDMGQREFANSIAHTTMTNTAVNAASARSPSSVAQYAHTGIASSAASGSARASGAWFSASGAIRRTAATRQNTSSSAPSKDHRAICTHVSDRPPPAAPMPKPETNGRQIWPTKTPAITNTMRRIFDMPDDHSPAAVKTAQPPSSARQRPASLTRSTEPAK